MASATTQSEERSSAARSEPHRLLLPLGAIAAFVAFGLLCWLFRDFTVDDLYIFLRYARNIAEGHGMRYNVDGPPTEGFSSPLWTLLLAGLTAFGASPAIAAKALSVLAGLACLTLLPMALPSLRAEYRVVAVLLAGFSGPLVLWSVSGMGTSLTAVYALVWVILIQRTELSPRNCLLLGIFSAAGMLVRPEVSLLWPALLVVITMGARDDRPRALLMSLAGAAIVWVPVEAFRLLYFGYPLPAPFYAKAVEPGLEQHFRGGYYIYEFLIRYAGGPLALIAVIYGFAPKQRSLRPLSLVACAWFLWVLVVGDDWMPQFRFLVPAIPAIAAITAALLQRIDDHPVGPVALRKVAIGATVIMLLAMQMAGLWLARNNNRHYAGYRMQIGYHIRSLEQLREQAEYLRDHGGADLVVAARDIGIVGYVSNARIIDLWGLTDYEIAQSGPYEAARHVLDREPDFWQTPFRYASHDPRFERWYEPVEGVPWKLYRRTETPAGASEVGDGPP